eukprot:616490-Prymnesium_polylepis.1
MNHESASAAQQHAAQQTVSSTNNREVQIMTVPATNKPGADATAARTAGADDSLASFVTTV